MSFTSVVTRVIHVVALCACLCLHPGIGSYVSFHFPGVTLSEYGNYLIRFLPLLVVVKLFCHLVEILAPIVAFLLMPLRPVVVVVARAVEVLFLAVSYLPGFSKTKTIKCPTSLPDRLRALNDGDNRNPDKSLSNLDEIVLERVRDMRAEARDLTRILHHRSDDYQTTGWLELRERRRLLLRRIRQVVRRHPNVGRALEPPPDDDDVPDQPTTPPERERSAVYFEAWRDYDVWECDRSMDG